MSFLDEYRFPKPRIESIGDFIRIILFILSPYLFWIYSNKFLGMSIDYLSSMARDITISETQMNPSFYPMESLALFLGGLILICFLLVQNELSTLFRGLRKGNFRVISECSSSIFVIGCFVVSYIVLITEGFGFLELSPGAQIPFFFFGGAVVAGVLLLQDNLSLILDPRNFSSFKRQEIIDAVISFGSILLLVALTVNISMIPLISQNIPQTLSIIILVTVFYWGFKLSQEAMKPSIQEKRTAALAYLAFLPFILYLFLRVLYLQHDPDPV
ncbi:MAG TPA: hypothetical protein QF508_03740, partial [Candidatus Thalassarchaeaceae archaeon]|nr:hypothetical protein [Candidatus Thalassarchaeaceae archaeon]